MNLLLQEEKSMEVKKPNKSLLFYAFVVMIILILLNAWSFLKFQREASQKLPTMSSWLFWMPSMSSR